MHSQAAVAALLAILIVLARGDDTGQFLVITDIHIDAYYGTPSGYQCTGASSPPFGTFGCDSPWSLFESVLAAAAIAVPSPDFILIVGDSLRHDMAALPNATATLVATMANVTELVLRYFPESVVVPSHGYHVIIDTLGNNDVVPDYVLPVAESPPILEAIANTWTFLDASEAQSFTQGGFFSRQVAPGLTVISLNTIPYSINHSPNTASDPDPFGQFAWLQGQLAAARANTSVAYLVGHVPPTFDSYACKSMWVAGYVATYYASLLE